MIRHYCTYFDERYLDKAICLAGSLARHAPDALLCCYTMSDRAAQAMRALALPNVKVIPMAEVEERDPQLRQAKQGRSKMSYYWTTTPVVMLHTLGLAGCDMAVYVDADLLFFGSPETMFAEDPRADLYIHEHRFDAPIAWYGRRRGRFNVGLVAARNTPASARVLERWRSQCLACCSAEPGKGGFGDQLYLDEWPSLEASVHVIQHPGAGAAPWNILAADVSQAADGSAMINGQPLIFYHFHALFRRPAAGWTLAWRYYVPAEVRRIIYEPYVGFLTEGSDRIRNAVPGLEMPVRDWTAADRAWEVLFGRLSSARLVWRCGSLLRG